MQNGAQMIVTPLAGVWIEILLAPAAGEMKPMSLPLRECGLKSVEKLAKASAELSLPLRECGLKLPCKLPLVNAQRHSPCGSVD